MGRRLFVIVLLASLAASGQLKKRDQKNEPAGAVAEEDEDLTPETEYVFNPIQAQKDLKVGDFYAKKGNHRAAVGRYLEATRWNPGFAEAYWKLAFSRDKLDQFPQAMEAYRKYVELDPGGKQVREAKKRIAELEAKQEKLPLAEGGPSPKNPQQPAASENPH